MGAGVGGVWGGCWFPSWYVVSIDMGHIAQSPQSAQEGVLLSRWSRSVCFLLRYQVEMHIGDIFKGENCMTDLLEKTQYTREGLGKQACQNVC